MVPSQKEYQMALGERKEAPPMAKGHSETTLNTVDKYSEARYKRTQEYILLKGYNHTVEKGEIHVLTGYTVYKNIAQVVEDKVIGLKAFDGIFIESYATHFISRVIGQTSTQHKGMRQGVPIEDVMKTLKAGRADPAFRLPDGDIRRQYLGDNCSVVISVKDNKIIQTNQTGG